MVVNKDYKTTKEIHRYIIEKDNKMYNVKIVYNSENSKKNILQLIANSIE